MPKFPSTNLSLQAMIVLADACMTDPCTLERYGAPTPPDISDFCLSAAAGIRQCSRLYRIIAQKQRMIFQEIFLPTPGAFTYYNAYIALLLHILL